MGLFDRFSGAGAATEAGDVQSQAALAGIPIAQQAFLGARQNIEPFAQTGIAALGSRAALAGLGGAEAQQAALGQLSESPGQRFIRERQQRALLRNASAIGGLGGGNIRTALQEQAAGFALQDLENQRRELAALSGGGLQAGLGLGTLGQAAAGQEIGLTQAEAAARASGIVGAQEAESSFFKDLTGVLTGIFG